MYKCCLYWVGEFGSLLLGQKKILCQNYNNELLPSN